MISCSMSFRRNSRYFDKVKRFFFLGELISTSVAVNIRFIQGFLALIAVEASAANYLLRTFAFTASACRKLNLFNSVEFMLQICEGKLDFLSPNCSFEHTNQCCYRCDRNVKIQICTNCDCGRRVKCTHFPESCNN